jgi:hypothetical protein
MTLSLLIGQVAAMEVLDGADVDLSRPFRLARFAMAGFPLILENA